MRNVHRFFSPRLFLSVNEATQRARTHERTISTDEEKDRLEEAFIRLFEYSSDDVKLLCERTITPIVVCVCARASVAKRVINIYRS